MSRGQQKVIVPKQDLSALSKLSSGQYGYIIRYRIVSEDQNRFSHWSPIKELEVPTISLVNGSAAINNNILQVVWEASDLKSSYDVFIKFDSDEYVYQETVSNTSALYLIPEGYSSIQVVVQIESIEKERSSLITIFESSVLSLV